MYVPQPAHESFRQFYYFLMAEVHAHIQRVVHKLQNSCFADNTIIIYTSGQLIGDAVWKYSRYFDNPRFYVGQAGNPDNVTTTRGIPDEFECYNLKEDPLELENRISPICPQPLPDAVHKALELTLAAQRKAKRLMPTTLNDQGSAGAAAPMQN